MTDQINTPPASVIGGVQQQWTVDVPSGFDAPAQFVNAGKMDMPAFFKAHADLAARAGDPAPEKPDGYQYQWADGEEKASDEDFAGLQAFAHALKMSPQQFKDFIPKSREFTKSVMEQFKQHYEDKYVPTPAKAETTLRQVWSDRAEFDKQIGFADKAMRSFVKQSGISPEDAARLGNDPAFIRIMSAIGPELGEDSRINTAAIMSEQSLAEIQSHPGYLNKAHPMHAQLQAQAMSHFENQARLNARKRA